MMEIVFETERLIVRRYTEEDEDNFFRLNSDPDVMRYIREPKSREECFEFLLQNIAAYKDRPLIGRWAMIIKQTGEFVGSFAIIPVEQSTETQLGYALLKEFWGRGYAAEATEAGKQYAFDVLRLASILGITEIANIASQRVLLKTGFRQLENRNSEGKELCFFINKKQWNRKAGTKSEARSRK